MKNQITVALAALSSLAFVDAAVAASQVAIDVSDDSIYMSSFASQGLVQSFIATADNVSGFAVKTHTTTSPGADVTLALFDGLPSLGGALLGSGVVSYAPDSWIEAEFAPVAVTVGASYYLAVSSTETTGGLRGSTENSYAGGQLWTNSGNTSWPNFDYAFRVLADDGITVPSDVPLPAAAPLALLGFGALAVAGRRRKA